MNGAKWSGSLVLALAWAGLACGQESVTSLVETVGGKRVITIQEAGKPPQRCRVLRSWREPDDMEAFEVESTTTGERMTIVGSGPMSSTSAINGPGKMIQAMSSRVYHWTKASSTPSTTPTTTTITTVSAPSSVMSQADVVTIPTSVSESSMMMPLAETTTPMDGMARTVPPYAAPGSKARIAGTNLWISGSAMAALPGTPVIQKIKPAAHHVVPEQRIETANVAPYYETAPASDWHQSWGKADDHRSRMPRKTDLPYAAHGMPDPLQDPEAYSPLAGEGTTDSKNETAEATEKKPVAEAQPVAEARPATAARPVTATAARVPPKTATGWSRLFGNGAAAGHTRPAQGAQTSSLAPGARSVLATGAASGQVMYVPVPVVTTPTVRPPAPPQPVRRAPAPEPSPSDEVANAFTTVPPSSTPKTSKPSTEVVNAFTTSGESAPAGQVTTTSYTARPGAFAPRPRTIDPNAFGGAATATDRRLPQPVPMLGAPASAAVEKRPAPNTGGHDLDQTLLILRNSLYPSHREWAAESLVAIDWNKHPIVVEALMQTAKEDPAGTVRAGCVRTLGKMNVNTISVVEMLQSLKTDADPQVRHEVNDTLARFGSSAARIQPASGPILNQ